MNSGVEKISHRTHVKAARVRPCSPRVTVVITCFNYGRYLAEAITSCLSQTGVEIEVIVVDDASTDNSLDIARNFAIRNTNVSVTSNQENIGAVESFNIGARLARGEFLVRLDADDLLSPGSLARSTLLAQSYPSIGLVYGHPIHFIAEPPSVLRTKTTSWTIWPGMDWLKVACVSGKNVITSPEVLMRTAVLRDLGYMSPLRYAHDMELWLRLSAFADVGYVHGADQALHREHPESMSAREVNSLTDLRERLGAFESLFLGRLSSCIPEAETLLQTARNAMVEEILQVARLEIDRGLRNPHLLSSYLKFAQELRPGIHSETEWKRLTVSKEKGAPVPWSLNALGRRAAARLQREIHWHRWRNNGVYIY